MRRAAAVTSIGPDGFMRSNKTIATDQDPCQWIKLSFPAKRKFKLPTVWQVLTSKLEITFFFHTWRKVFKKCLLQKLDLQSFPSFHCDWTFVNIFVECFESISGGFLIKRHVSALFDHHQTYKKMVLIKVHSFAIPMGSHGLHWSLCLFKNYLLLVINYIIQ